MGNGKHYITAIATDNNSNINTLPNPLCPRDSAHPEPQQVSTVVACPCTDYINYSEAPETSHCQNLTCYAKHAALSMTPDILKIEAFRHWRLGGFPRILRCLFTGTSGPLLSLGLGGEMPEVVRRTIESV